MVWVNFKNFLVGFLSFLTVSFLFINNCQVKQGSGVGLLVNGDLEVMDSFVHILAELVKQNAHVKVGLEVLRVDGKCSLVKLSTLLEGLISGGRLLQLDALGETVDGVDAV